ncbi:beta-glucuronidase [Aquimarina addita]|uniref:Beta-glucuronidase n=1 Tax=Aquimarina addita TaxID=870485 RepID=A0ABP6UI11_9FLAO
MRFLIVFILSCTLAFSQENNLINVYNRDQISLNGDWNYIVDPYENGFYNYRYQPFENSATPGKAAFFMNSKPENESDLVEYDFDSSDIISVPGDWNTQKEKLFYYEGTLWYKKSFNYQKSKDDNKVFVYFDAVNYQADVYLNGKKLGKHIGGFTPFNFEITNLLKQKENFLVVKVDNKRKKEGVPTLNTDWLNYGGITRDVRLVEVPENFVKDYVIQLNPDDNTQIKGFITLSGKDIAKKKVELSIPDLQLTKELITDENGTASIDIQVKNMIYWEPEHPYLHKILIKTTTDFIEDQIGFRTIKTKGHDILLNDKSIFLKGICLHEESPINKGRGHTKEDAKQLLNWAKELGCNYVRLAHYPHNEHMVRLADKMGIMVWEENPVYWTIEWENKDTYKNAENQLIEVIDRDKNRASVIIWSMANETPTSEARNLFLTNLAKKTKALDPTRLISAALEQHDYKDSKVIRTIDDPFAEVVDILSFNQYIGWYDGLPEKCNDISWKIVQDKPVLISEFGAGAKHGFHGDNLTRWSEEYQANLYTETLKMLDRVEQLRGFSPWILVDFRSPRRVLPEIQDGYNRKGLISEKGEKKEAFDVLRKYYEQKK